MKRITIALVMLLTTASLLCACSLGGTVTIGTFLTTDQASSIDADLLDGSTTPSELVLTIDNGYADTITDQAFVSEVWDKLISLEISSRASNATPSLNGSVAFSFSWDDGRQLTFGFDSTEFFQANDETLHKIKDPNEMGAILTSLVEYLETADAQAQDSSDGSLAISNNDTFLWDSNGDGVNETYVIRYYDNGDEAPNVVEIVDAARDYESAWIDGAYEVKSIVPGEGEWGRYLTVTYLSGDFYAHDTESTCEIYVIDGALSLSHPGEDGE
ncbi:MAG: hypothetical protein IJ781_14475 [Atopobiaceae bacterium]|nr:hypothetical protein [Atopobiaceae bacterium]